MKSFLVLALALTATSEVTAQFSKGTWMLGGTARYSWDRFHYESSVFNQTSRLSRGAISSNIGYFLGNDFVGGVRLSHAFDKSKVSGSGTASLSREKFNSIGPFVRYYFPLKKSLRLVSDLGYQFGHSSLLQGDYKEKVNRRQFIAMGGPAYLFNKNISAELLLGYTNTFKNNSYRTSGLRLSAGVQFHVSSKKH